jgi:hypothetical protein
LFAGAGAGYKGTDSQRRHREAGMNVSIGRSLIAALAMLALAGCGSSQLTETPNTDPDIGFEHTPTSSMAGDGGLLGNIFGNKKSNPDQGVGGSSLGVNAYLWRGALDTLSFMPLQSADPFGGVIITDWYSPPDTPTERFKATAYILGRQLRADAIRVTLFRQVFQDGHWIDASVSPVTVGDIENKVLARARELRVQTASE